MTCTTRFLAALFAIACAHVARAQSLYGIRWDDGVLFSISTTDASSTIIGTTSVPSPADMILASDGFLYSVSAGSAAMLYRVDPSSAATTPIGALNVGHVFEGALATSPAGITYGLNAGYSGAPGVFQIDLSTGAATIIATLSNPPHDINAAMFRSDGVMVGIDGVTNALLQIDPTTGATSVIQVLTPTLGGVSGLAESGGLTYFATGGTSGGFSSPNELWRIDLFTGAHSLVGNMGQGGNGIGISGLANVVFGSGVGTPFCFGDGSSTACPCGNSSLPADQVGCLHSLGFGGKLRAHGNASIALDTIVLDGSSMPNGTTLYFQGTATIAAGAGIVFGDGLRCVAGTVIRLGTKQNSSGASQYPVAGDQSVSVRGLVPAGSTRHYQAWFRNAATFCTTSTFNLTNGLTLSWLP